jgi:hypothetical protein
LERREEAARVGTQQIAAKKFRQTSKTVNAKNSPTKNQ